MKSPLSYVTASATAKSLNIVGDQWSYLLLRDMFLGRHRFEELLESTGASRGTLTKRLKSLVDHGVLRRSPIRQSRRFDYRLTEKGLALYPLAIAAWQWELKWAAKEAFPLPQTLVHKHCQQATTPFLACGHCKEQLFAHDVHYSLNADPSLSSVALPWPQKRGRSTVKKSDADQRLFHVIDAVSDRWTSLILAGAFMGADRFDVFHQELNIATNILTERLKKLVSNNILERKQYQSSPPRYAYKLTSKAYDLYPLLLSLHQWGRQWLEGENSSSVIELTHKCGQHPFTAELVCNACHQVIENVV